ncbi:glycosyltransferase [Snuella sedimenti]|uniref:Glycosyltransferase n=1 Tax=Snuella sedimenti TaxID=2798802 RepID=A0A8J7LS87_9FLAO|nr:glycosyltransferase [Snuella sedimenti]MBJ6368160.1 glycosyltransferase [Snuella sedimenti]
MTDKNKPKLLMIFHRPPFPLIGGDKIRMYQNLKILSGRYNIDVLFVNDKKTDESIKENILKLANEVIIFEFKKYKFYLTTLFGFVFNRNPLQVNYYYFKEVQKWVDNNINNYDLVFCHTIRSAEYVKDKAIFKIIDFVDAISMNYEKAANKSNFGMWNLLYKIDKGRVLQYELSLLKLFDKKIIISEIDRNYILSKSNSNVQIDIVQNAVQTSLVESKKEEDYIIFVGKMDYEPNISAVKYFSLKVFPRILERFPKLKFYIVGVNPTKKVKSLSKKSNIKVVGYVENLEDVILKSKLVVAPMISGAGIQNKILMAMGLKKCVVTTKIGAEGLENLDVKNNRPIEVSESTLDLIESTIELLEDKTERDQIGESAYNYISNYFSFNKIKKDLLYVMET